MRANLSLSQQGLILVGLPVGLMLVFLFILLVLFQKVEHEAKETDHSKTIISTANSLVKRYYTAGSRLVAYKWARTKENQEKLDQQLQGTEDTFNELRELLKADKEETIMLADLKKLALKGIKLMRFYEDSLSGKVSLNALGVAEVYKELDQCGIAFTDKLEELVSTETARHHVSSEKEQQTRSIVLLCIIGGIALATASGIILAVYFTRNTTDRLSLLMENTVRLGKKEELLPRLSGEDEIGRLDLFFHRMADELAEAMHKQMAMMDNAVDVICSIGPDGLFTNANQATLQAWGLAPESLIGRHVDQLLVKEDAEKFLQTLNEIQKKPEPIDLESRVKGADDKEHYMLWSLRWSETEKSLFCVAHDISDRKEVERLKQEFVSVISHELRTPLTALEMMLGMLVDGAYGELTKTGVKRVKGAELGISRLVGLINDLLDIGKMEAGKLSMQYGDADLGDIAEKSFNSVQGFAEQQGVTIKLQTKSVKLWADANRLVQVLVNLLSNAVKFSDDGGVIEVSIREDNEFAEVMVVDHGMGVPDGMEDTIFEKYEQAHTDDGSKRRKGTGLGLAICKAIVQHHGGSIGLRKTDGGGSTFWFKIPLKSSQSARGSVQVL